MYRVKVTTSENNPVYDTDLILVGPGVYYVCRNDEYSLVVKTDNSHEALVLAGKLEFIFPEDFPYYLVVDAEIAINVNIELN
jgi:hypothetical protein